MKPILNLTHARVSWHVFAISTRAIPFPPPPSSSQYYVARELNKCASHSAAAPAPRHAHSLALAPVGPPARLRVSPVARTADTPARASSGPARPHRESGGAQVSLVVFLSASGRKRDGDGDEPAADALDGRSIWALVVLCVPVFACIGHFEQRQTTCCALARMLWVAATAGSWRATQRMRRSIVCLRRVLHT